jgi:hypothetical protein
VRRLHVVAVVITALALAGCEVDAHVLVTMNEDGSGTVQTTVTLDAEAVARVETDGRTLETAFPLGDFADAGWTVGAWERAEDGGAEIVFSRAYAGEEQLNQRLVELVGDTGILRDAQIDRERGLFKTRDEVSLAADVRTLSAGVEADPELAASLTAAGLDVATLDEQLTTELRDAFRLRVTLEGPSGKTDTVSLVAGEDARLAAADSDFNSDRLFLLLIAGALVFLAVLLYLSASISARRSRARHMPPPEPDRTPLM